MVKLFVGNLADSVDSHRLKNLFLQYVTVIEADVLKNFAFVHVGSDEDAEQCINKLHKTIFEGRELHVERSTSKLRKEPGMSEKCFTCGASDHKTPNCPQEMNRRKRRLDENEDIPTGPNGKKPTILPTINLASNGSSTSWTGCKVGGGNDADPELPRPTNPELGTLYEQYMDARTKYFFFRERLSKELSMQPLASQSSMHVGRYDMTKQSLPQMSKPLVMQPGQMTASAPAMQYSTAPASYQPPIAAAPLPPSVYASANPQVVPSNAPYSNRQPMASYVTSTPSIIGQQPVSTGQAPTAPYNSLVRQPAAIASVNYAAPQSSAPAGQYVIQNGGQPNQPSAPYSSATGYRPPQQPYPYSTIPAGPR
ncbi:hypothetical protein M3Y97_00126900 [Aphelenchoides bicaudatus]|nr:hypothetical protein M3Y97_00126900 [Aphelenchoides bicaudatus]